MASVTAETASGIAAEDHSDIKRRKLGDSNPKLTTKTTSTITPSDYGVHSEEAAGEWITKYRSRRTLPSYNDVARSRMAKQKFNVLFRPLNNVRVGDIPRRALSRFLSMIAPEDTTNGLTSTAINHRANSITITFYSADQAAKLCKQSQMIIGDRNIQFEAQVLRPKGTSRGVIRVDPGDSNADLRSHTTCESANILDIRRLGKTNWALVTFDTVIPPKTPSELSVKFLANPNQPAYSW
ncbi:hypothetical protein HPB48_014356 [Haemaphysalis longicornis]|uniref:Uncharacterized protein n=1 Tax=Haemaphysalis longicornis TaxID=44386 RepID=A0A9J6G4L8_HAELO|nr:hypothetical protein HPB48_014356 [Haemaphysalis longicornis]